MLELRPHFPLADLLRAAELARSSFYYQLKALRTGDKHCNSPLEAVVDCLVV